MRIRGARRRTEEFQRVGITGGEATDRRDRWRRTLATFVIATMAASGLALVASPAMAADGKDKKSDSVVEETVIDAPAEEAAIEPPAEEAVVEAPAEEAPAEAPAEEAITETPTEDLSAPPGEEPTAAQESTLRTDDGAAAGAMQAMLVPPGDEVVRKVKICHATAAYNNPYVVNNPAADGDVSGHAGHTGPIFYPEITETWGDIIPPFTYDGGSFPGLNWDADGQAIYENGCNLPDTPPEPPIMYVESTDCFVYLAPSLTVWLYDLQGDVDYRVTVMNADGIVDVWDVEAGTEGDTSFTWDPIPGGDYTVTLEQAVVPGEWETVTTDEFSVTDCPVLGVTAKATACSNGDDGTAVVTLTGLVPGEEYSWTLSGPDGLVADGTLDDEVTSDTLEVPFGDFAPGDYVFGVMWQWDDEHQESAEAAFTVDACPVVPPTPPKPAVLAASGSEGTGGLLTAALVLFGLGGAALAYRARRPIGARDEQ
jgi:hypothetical protein